MNCLLTLFSSSFCSLFFYYNVLKNLGSCKIKKYTNVGYECFRFGFSRGVIILVTENMYLFISNANLNVLFTRLVIVLNFTYRILIGISKYIDTNPFIVQFH